MARIYKSTGQSVGLQEAQRGGDPGYIQAPNQINQIDAIGRQAQRSAQSFQEQVNRNAQFEQTTLARAQRAQEQNAALALQQEQVRQQTVLRTRQIQAEAAFSADRMRMQQQTTANQISLNNQQYEIHQLTNLGNSFINFSKTLWEEKAKRINKENEELLNKGKIDWLNNYTDPKYSAVVSQVNQAEVKRTQGVVNAEIAAQQLEADGKKGDATIVRSGNPWYLRGQEEGQAIKAGLGYPAYLQNRVRKDMDEGRLNVLDPQFQAKLAATVADASQAYFAEQKLGQVSTGVLSKYFGYTKAQTEAQLLEQYNNLAYKNVKEAQRTTADAQVYNSATAIRAMPRGEWAAEFQKLAAINTSAYSLNPLEGYQAMLKQLIKEADVSGNFDLVTAFMGTDRGDGQPFGATPGLQEVYDKANSLYLQKQAAQLEKLQGDQIEAIKGDFDRIFATGDVNSIREAQDTAVGRLMQVGTPEAMAMARNIASTNPGESPMIKEQIRRAEDRGYLDRFLRENRDRMTASTYEQAAKRAENTSKLKEPAYQQALDQTLAQIRFSADAANQERDPRLIPPHAKRALASFVKRQEGRLQQFAREWLAENPGSNIKDFQDWLKGQEKSYTDPKQFEILKDGPGLNMPRGMYLLRDASGNPEFSDHPLVVLTKKGYEDYRNPKVIEGLANGTISGRSIQFHKDPVFGLEAIKQAVKDYEKNGTWPNYMVQIASRNGRTVKSMVQAQARLYGGSGVIMDPGNFKLPPSPSGRGGVSFDAVRNFGQSLGMSERGSIAFATMVKDESGGDPLAVGDGGAASGLMQWNRAVSPDRVRRLQNYAKQLGKPVTDPGVQLNFATYEMKNFYPSAWAVLTSRNPTNNQLWRASVEYLGFSPSVYAKRRASLENNLR